MDIPKVDVQATQEVHAELSGQLVPLVCDECRGAGATCPQCKGTGVVLRQY